MTTQACLARRARGGRLGYGHHHPESGFRPAMDVHETEKGLDLTLDMPGVSPDNVNLTVENDTVTVVGKVAPEQEGSVVYRETHIGDYRRVFRLGEDLDAEQISAEMKDGVLTVHVPKAAKAQPRRIDIVAN